MVCNFGLRGNCLQYKTSNCTQRLERCANYRFMSRIRLGKQFSSFYESFPGFHARTVRPFQVEPFGSHDVLDKHQIRGFVLSFQIGYIIFQRLNFYKQVMYCQPGINSKYVFNQFRQQIQSCFSNCQFGVRFLLVSLYRRISKVTANFFSTWHFLARMSCCGQLDVPQSVTSNGTIILYMGIEPYL